MIFDIDELAASRQSTYRLVVGHNPGEPPEEVGFIVVGPNSEEYQKASREAAIDGVQKAEKRGAEKVEAGTRESAEAWLAARESSNDAVVLGCTTGWFGFRRGEKPAPFNRSNLESVLKSRPHWRQRILNAIENSANFGEG